MKLNSYQCLMLYMAARILQILRAHYNVGNWCDDQEHIQAAIDGSVAGALPEDGGHTRTGYWEDHLP